MKFDVRFSSRRAAAAIVLSWIALSNPAMGQDATLVGWWELSETDDAALVVDSSGNELDGFFDGFTDPDVEGSPFGQASYPNGLGSAAYFDGIDSAIALDPLGDAPYREWVNNFSVVAWINPEQFDSKNRIFGTFPVGGGWGFGTNGDSLEITTYGVRDYTQPVPLELDTWQHVAVTLDSENAAHFYVDGEFVGTQTHGSPGNPTPDSNEFFIGTSCCDAEYFQGFIDEVAIFDGVLTDQQVWNIAHLSVASFDAEPEDPAGLKFKLDFATHRGGAEGWDIIDEIDAGDTCTYQGADTPCTVFELTDLEGTDTDVTLEILERPFIGNSTPHILPDVIAGVATPAQAIGDYQYRDPDTADSSAPFRFSNLDPGTYMVTVTEGRTTDGNGQFAKLWVGDADGSNEPGTPGSHDGENTGDFAAGFATLELTIGEGEFLWYRHLEDNSGGISTLTIRSMDGGVVEPTCDPDTGGDLNADGEVSFADFLILSSNFGTDVPTHAEGDIDCDGSVAFSDFLVLSSNFGTTVATASVPEPAGFSLTLLTGMISLVTLRRRTPSAQ